MAPAAEISFPGDHCEVCTGVTALGLALGFLWQNVGDQQLATEGLSMPPDFIARLLHRVVRRSRYCDQLEPSHEMPAVGHSDLGRKPKGCESPSHNPEVGRCWSLSAAAGNHGDSA